MNRRFQIESSTGCTVSITGIISLFMITAIVGCAGSMQHLAPRLAPIPVTKENMQPLSFKGVVLRIPVGQQIGKHYDGLARVPQYSLNWQSGISFGSEEFTLRASATLRDLGYNVLGGDNLLFGNSEAAKATFQLGATITNLKYNTFGPLAGNFNEAIVYATWELYDALERRVVLSQSTEGFASSAPREKPAVFDAFTNALRNLLADSTFVAALEVGGSPPVLTNEGDRISIAIPLQDTLNNLPADFDKVMNSVVTIRVGSTIATGFLISTEGYLVTAAHVVSGVDEVQVAFQSGLTLTGTLVKADNRQDVAILKLPGSGYPCLQLELNKKPNAGTEVYAVGTPLSEELSFSITRGVVSGTREFKGVPYVQTDASLNPGNSGGPLLDGHARVIGVVSWKVVIPGYEGLAFGVPVSAISKSLNVEWETREVSVE